MEGLALDKSKDRWLLLDDSHADRGLRFLSLYGILRKLGGCCVI